MDSVLPGPPDGRIWERNLWQVKGARIVNWV